MLNSNIILVFCNGCIYAFLEKRSLFAIIQRILWSSKTLVFGGIHLMWLLFFWETCVAVVVVAAVTAHCRCRCVGTLCRRVAAEERMGKTLQTLSAVRT